MLRSLFNKKIFYRARGTIFFLGLLLLISNAFSGCKKDDEELTYTIRDRKEQYAAEKDSILSFLQSHTYIVDVYGNIIIKPLEYSWQVSLYDQAEVVEMEDPEVEDLVYEVYYIRVEEGTGDTITTTDNVLLSLKIYNFDLECFLEQTELFPVWVNVWMPIASVRLLGLRYVLPRFRVGTYRANPDGTVTFEGKGIGMAVLPSGLANYELAYMSNDGAVLSSYSPVVVTFKTLHINTDLDNDNVPNVVEDLNGNGDPTDDNTDKELEEKYNLPSYPNYVDADDDGDGLPTKDEDTNGNGDPTDDDDDGDGIPNYLDPDTH